MEGGMIKATYAGLSGAEFMREVSDDPEKWAEALYDAWGKQRFTTHAVWSANREERIEELAKWFRDAMDAARRLNPKVVP
jgi:hypothetical protein